MALVTSTTLLRFTGFSLDMVAGTFGFELEDSLGLGDPVLYPSKALERASSKDIAPEALFDLEWDESSDDAYLWNIVVTLSLPTGGGAFSEGTTMS
ncbi:hypothetical protein C8J56DRAFT_979928 [Mycena floridula]|nr:hypothetical protein C8J56DRAFT_979928 [Mycena floridula]